MSKEIKALVVHGSEVTQVRPVLVRGIKRAPDAKKRATQTDSSLTVKRQPIATVSFGRVVVKSEIYKRAAYIAIVGALGVFAAVAAISFVTTVAIPAYHNYVYKTKAERIARQQTPSSFRISSVYTDDELSLLASQEYASIPKMIDKTTRIDSIIGVSDELQYNLTLIDISSSSVAWASFKKTLEMSLVNWVCTSRHIVEVFINKGVTVSFAYFGYDRGLIGVVSVEPSMCIRKTQPAK
jgi:hypothetical protein